MEIVKIYQCFLSDSHLCHLCLSSLPFNIPWKTRFLWRKSEVKMEMSNAQPSSWHHSVKICHGDSIINTQASRISERICSNDVSQVLYFYCLCRSCEWSLRMCFLQGEQKGSQSREFRDVFNLPGVDETCGENWTKKGHTFLIDFHRYCSK